MERILLHVSVGSIFIRHPALRWIVPTCVVGVVALIASGVLSAQASPHLPPRTAAQLLADVKGAHVDGLSGTIVAKSALGIRGLPDSISAGDGLLGLLSGSHTARVWYAGPQKQRFAMLDTLSETDVFHNGRDLWTYDSSTREATHTLLPVDSAGKSKPAPTTSPTLTPEQAAEQALKAIDPTTIVSTDAARHVAGRDAYELVLAPRDTSSQVGSVRIAIDGSTKVPLGVQVYAKGGHSPAIDVSYTRITYAVPDMDNFTFHPPKSVKIKESPLVPGGPHATHDGDIATIGKGWTTVVRLRSTDIGASGAEKQYIDSLPKVSWTGGSGRLFEVNSGLVTALITDDGRVYAGAVDESVLIAAAARHK
jgi:outer membrane lipoprotein-sorting protein